MGRPFLWTLDCLSQGDDMQLELPLSIDITDLKAGMRYTTGNGEAPITVKAISRPHDSIIRLFGQDDDGLMREGIHKVWEEVFLVP